MNKESIIRQLKRLSSENDLTFEEDVLSKAVELARFRVYPKGSVIKSIGDKAESVTIVLDGLVRGYYIDAAKQEIIPLGGNGFYTECFEYRQKPVSVVYILLVTIRQEDDTTMLSNPNNTNYDFDEQAKIMLDRFISQLNTPSEKADPDDASADLKYTRALQRNRLLKKGVSMSVDYSQNYDNMIKGIAWKMDKDARYVTRIPFHAVKAKIGYSIGGKLKKKIYEKQNLYAYTMWLKGQTDADYVCPHCGAATRVSKLTDGCEYCGTRFLMHELYPKITSFYTLKSVTYILRNIAPFVVAGIVLAPIFTFLFNYNNMIQAIQTLDIASIAGLIISLVLSIGAGAVLGYVLFAASTLGLMLWKVITSIPALVKFIKIKRNLPGFMKSVEPDFSLDYFIVKLMNLTSTMVFSENYDDLTVYAGEPMQNTFGDIIDLRWNGIFNLNQYYVKDGFVYMDVTMYMDDVHCKGKRIFGKKDKFRLLLCKSVSAGNDYGFTIHAVSCPTCGASFDASRIRHCPNCSNEYNLVNRDWVIMKFDKV